ncbi:hypothetical protein ACOMHN_028882 [Nucella lapillus]
MSQVLTPDSVTVSVDAEDPRFNDAIGQMTGYQAESLLCHPIRNADDEIVGVAQLLNKTNDEAFSKDDEMTKATSVFPPTSPVENRKGKNKTQLFDEETSMTLQEAIETLSVKLQKAVETINERLESLSAKSEVVEMRAEVKDLTDMFKEKIEGIEGRLLDVECKIDNLESGSRNAKKFNKGLKNMVTQCDSHLKQCEKEQNDLQQYSRRWNLRVYRVPEQTKETAGDCVDKVVKIVNEGVGVKLTQGDVEVAHRTGHQSGKQARPIIVRFFDRRKRDEILQNRRNLKNKGTVIGEDFTYANNQLSKRAMEHSLTMSVWSSNGRILAKIKNGRILRLHIYMDLDEVFKRAMRPGNSGAEEHDP